MKIFDDFAGVLFEFIMSHGTSQQAVLKLEKALDKLENLLKSSKTSIVMN